VEKPPPPPHKKATTLGASVTQVMSLARKHYGNAKPIDCCCPPINRCLVDSNCCNNCDDVTPCDSLCCHEPALESPCSYSCCCCEPVETNTWLRTILLRTMVLDASGGLLKSIQDAEDKADQATTLDAFCRQTKLTPDTKTNDPTVSEPIRGLADVKTENHDSPKPVVDGQSAATVISEGRGGVRAGGRFATADTSCPSPPGNSQIPKTIANCLLPEDAVCGRCCPCVNCDWSWCRQQWSPSTNVPVGHSSSAAGRNAIDVRHMSSNVRRQSMLSKYLPQHELADDFSYECDGLRHDSSSRSSHDVAFLYETPRHVATSTRREAADVGRSHHDSRDRSECMLLNTNLTRGRSRRGDYHPL